MRKIKYSKDVDALLIEFSDKKIDHTEEEGTGNYPFLGRR